MLYPWISSDWTETPRKMDPIHPERFWLNIEYKHLKTQKTDSSKKRLAQTQNDYDNQADPYTLCLNASQGEFSIQETYNKF